MMFIMHISALFALSVLLGSTVLVIWSLRNKGEGSALGKAIGSVVFVLSVISLLCIGYYGLKYWVQGDFETPTSVTMQMRQDMMEKMMPMMQQMMPMMMEKMTGQMGKMGDKSVMEKSPSNMYNMEHLQNMGSQQAIEQMQKKD